ncbi:glycoside hydrolase, partial [Ascobolus immersus RN42]
VSAHGFLQTITTPDRTYPGWSPYTDPHIKPEPKRYTRRYFTNGPVPDFTSSDIACNVGGNSPISEYINVKAGDKITFQWDTWPETHKGPILTYLLPCPGPCSHLTLPTTNTWYKIHQSGYTGGIWATDRLIAQNLTSTLTLPSTLPSGEYLLRHEILALHEAGREKGAQFYPSCAQLKVEGPPGEKDVWKGLEGVRLPGVYEVEGEGVLVDIY